MDFKKLLKKRSRTLQRRNMDMMFEAYLTHESGHLEPDDIPHTKEPVWILGKKYSALHGKIRYLTFSIYIFIKYLFLLIFCIYISVIA